MSDSSSVSSDAPVPLSTVGPAQRGPEPSGPPLQIKEESYDPLKDRESLRGRIATWLIGTLVAVIVIVVLLAFVTAALCGYSGACNADTLELKSIRTIIELVLTPLVGLVGAVTGFYFGEKSGERTSGS